MAMSVRRKKQSPFACRNEEYTAHYRDLFREYGPTQVTGAATQTNIKTSAASTAYPEQDVQNAFNAIGNHIHSVLQGVFWAQPSACSDSSKVAAPVLGDRSVDAQVPRESVPSPSVMKDVVERKQDDPPSRSQTKVEVKERPQRRAKTQMTRQVLATASVLKLSTCMKSS